MTKLKILAAIAAVAIAAPTLADHHAATKPATAPATEAPAAEAAAETPSADAILEKHIEATGGREAYEAIDSRRSTGTLSVPQMGVNGAPMKVVQTDDPLRMSMQMTIPGLEELNVVYDGENAWRTSLMQGASLIEGEELDQLLLDLDTDKLLNFTETFPTREVLGTEPVDGTDAYKLRLVTADGMETTRYYAVDSGLLIKEERVVTTQGNSVPATMLYKEYETFGDNGLMVPTVTEQSAMGATYVITVDELELNPEIDESAFDVPESVQPLLGETAEEEVDEEEDEAMQEAAE